MTLNAEQRDGTRAELRRNLELAEMTPAMLAIELGFTQERLDATLEVRSDSDPADVWMLRDLLEAAVRRLGRIPEHYTVLTEDRRADARRWFGVTLRRPDRS